MPRSKSSSKSSYDYSVFDNDIIVTTLSIKGQFDKGLGVGLLGAAVTFDPFSNKGTFAVSAFGFIGDVSYDGRAFGASAGLGFIAGVGAYTKGELTFGAEYDFATSRVSTELEASAKYGAVALSQEISAKTTPAKVLTTIGYSLAEYAKVTTINKGYLDAGVYDQDDSNRNPANGYWSDVGYQNTKGFDAVQPGQGLGPSPYTLEQQELLQKRIDLYGKKQLDQLNALPEDFCFPAGTLIEMWPLHLSVEHDQIYDEKEILAKAWIKPIEEVLPSDWVLSYDDGGRLKPGRVVRLFDNITDEWVELSMENGAGDMRKLTATPGHVFLNEFGDHEQIQSMLQRGNGAAMLVNIDGSFVRAGGELVCFSHANAGEYEQAQGFVNAVEGGMALEPQLKTGWRTYNFEVETYHTYIAGGVRVHNVSEAWAHELDNPDFVNDVKEQVEVSVKRGVPREYAEALGRAKAAAEDDVAYTSIGRQISIDESALDSYRAAHGRFGKSDKGTVEAIAYGATERGNTKTDVFAAAVHEGLKRGLSLDEATRHAEVGNRASKNKEKFPSAPNDKSAGAVSSDAKSGLEGFVGAVAGAVGAVAGAVAGAIGGIASAIGSVFGGGESPGDGGGGGKSPVLVDLDGNGVSITELSHSNIFLDTTDDGLQNRTAWAGAGDAVLFYDPDNLDTITETRQFIFTEWDPTAESDLEAVRSVFDSNKDGKLTAADDAFADFKLMVTNADGSTSAITLGDANIVEIDLNPDATLITLPDGSQITGQTSYTFADGTTGIVADAILQSDILSYKVLQTSSVAFDGSRTVETKGFTGDGDLAFSIHSLTSGDGSNIYNQYDDNGDGTVDRIQKIETILDPSGVKTKTVSNWVGSSETLAALANREVMTTSADGNVIVIERDSSGGGWFDEVETRTTDADGALQVETVWNSEDGSILERISDQTSADGNTRTRDVDVDGDLDIDVTSVQSITEHVSGERSQSETILNGDGTLRSSSSEHFSADRSMRTLSEDLDGDGASDSVASMNISRAADGSSTFVSVITNGDGSLRTSTTTFKSEDARSETVSVDLDGDGLIDQTISNVTTIVDGVRTETFTKTNADGSLQSLAKNVLGQDGITRESWVDLNQDQVFQATDLVSAVSVDLSTGDRTTSLFNRNEDGSFSSHIETVTSEDGLVTSIASDEDGDGNVDSTASDVTVVHGDGSSTKTIEIRNADGTLREAAQTQATADGLSSITSSDIDGDGLLDSILSELTTLHADGSITRVVSEFAGDGTTLLNKVTTDDSADRLSRTISVDDDGDGNIDSVEDILKVADGSATLSVSQYNPDGSLNSKSVSLVSPNGLSTTSSVDANADDIDETVVAEETVYNIDGSVTHAVSTNNGDGSLRSKVVETVSDDGLVITTQSDLDGDGNFDETLVSTSVLNADGSVATTEQLHIGDGANVRSQMQTVVSDDGLEISVRYDNDGDGQFDLVESEITQLQFDGDTQITREVRDSNDLLRSKQVTTSLDNGRQVSILEDVNGDGVFDSSVTTTIAENGVETLTKETLDTNSIVQSRTIESVSADGQTQTSQFDLDGDGVFEQTVMVNTELDLDGSVTSTNSLRSSGGLLISQTVNVISADELLAEVTEDIDGDGIVDSRTEIDITLSADGTRTETESRFNADGSLFDKTIQFTSADQRAVITSIDLDGDDIFDVITTSAEADSGRIIEKTTHFSADGVELSVENASWSADGLTLTNRIDRNADGQLDLFTKEQTVLGADGSVVRNISYKDSQYLDLGSARYETRDNALFKETSFDLDGNGIYELKSQDITTLNADGSTLQVLSSFDGDAALLSQISTTVSSNGLEIETQENVDLDDQIDRIHTRVTAADGGWTEEYKYLSNTNTTLRLNTITQSFDGRTLIEEFDENGDALFDFKKTTQINLDGITFETLQALNELGGVENNIEIETSANDHSQTIRVDVDGDGSFDIVRTLNTEYSSNGAKVTSIHESDGDGNLISSSQSSYEANGLSYVTETDINGDGVTDQVSTSQTTINVDGSKTTVLESKYSDGSLMNRFSSVESADGRHVEALSDYDGDGVDDFRAVTTTRSDGQTRTVQTSYHSAGHKSEETTTTTSADGLTITIAGQNGHQIITSVPGDSGSYEFRYEANPGSLVATFETEHKIDAFGIDTWTIKYLSQTSHTVRIDAESKDIVLGEAGALYDTILDRDLNRIESEQLAEYVSDGLLQRASLVQVLLNSDEFATRYGTLSDSAFVNQLYLNSFGRSATLVELDSYLNELGQSANTRAGIATKLAFSNEHQLVGNEHRMTNNYNVSLDELSSENVLDYSYIQTVVSAVIAIAYGRVASSHELESFSKRVHDGEVSIVELTGELLETDGGLPGVITNSLHALSGAGLIEQAISNAFGRMPTNDELSIWNDRISSGSLTEVEFVALLAQSPEHLAVVGSNFSSTGVVVNNVNGTAVDETLNGTDQQDLLNGSDGEDTINGNDQADILIGGTGNDHLDGGWGADRYEWSKGDGNDTIYDTASSKIEIDILALIDVNSTDVQLTRVNGFSDLVIEILSTGETITVTNRYYTGDHSYGIEAIEFANNEVWQLEDILSNTVVMGTSSGDTFNSIDYSVNIYGFEGDDTLSGSSGADLLVGGIGNDILNGGLGGDIYEWSKGHGNDVLDDTGVLQSEIDRLILTDVSFDDVRLTRANGSFDLAVEILSTGETIQIVNTYQDKSLRYGVEVIEFGDGVNWTLDDILSNTAISGSSSNDILVGSEYSDNMYGFEGDDTLQGGIGSDILNGGLGDDLLYGGVGSDRYEWSTGNGNDVLVDDSSVWGEVDTLALLDVEAADVDLSQVGNHLYVKLLSSGESISITNQFYSSYNGYGIERLEFSDGVHTQILNGTVTKTITTGTNANNIINGWEFADFVSGMGGDDNIHGLDGADVLLGGFGNDYIDGGNGADVIIGGAGADIMRGGASFGGFSDANASGNGGAENALRKVSGGALWNGGAYSVQNFTGAGSFAVTMPDNHNAIMFGLSSSSEGSGYATIDFAIHPEGTGISIYESGSKVGTFSHYNSNDVLSIQRATDGTIAYLKNDAVFYLSTKQSLTDVPLFADVSIYSVGGLIGNSQMTIGVEPAINVDWITDGYVEIVPFAESLEIEYVDLDQDGNLDALVTSTNGDIWTRFGTEEGNFADSQYWGNGTKEDALASYGVVIDSGDNGNDQVNTGFDPSLDIYYADINEDTIQDVLLSSQQGEIWTRLGAGDGSYAAAVAHGSGANSNVLKKSGADGWNGGAYSAESFIGAGSLEVTVPSNNLYAMFGLSDAPAHSGWSSIDYAFYPDATGLQIYEFGSSIGFTTAYATGDVLSIARASDGTVTYLNNGEVIHTSIHQSNISTPLFADVSIYSQHGLVGDARIISDGNTPKLVTWLTDDNVDVTHLGSNLSIDFRDINLDGKLDALISGEDGQIWTRLGSVDGGFEDALSYGNGSGSNALQKTKGSDAWDGGSFSQQNFVGEGSLSVTMLPNSLFAMFGLSANPDSSHWSSLDYALYPDTEGVHVYEHGVNLGMLPGSHRAGDIFTISRSADGTISYLRNDEVLRVSSQISSPDVALSADASIYSFGGIVGDAVFSIGSDAPQDVIWITDENVEPIPLGAKLTVDYSDVNSDNIADILISSEYGEIWTRFGQGYNDVFRFEHFEDSTVTQTDTILDFNSTQDRLDFRALNVDYEDVNIAELADATNVSIEGTDFLVQLSGIGHGLTQDQFLF